MLAGHGERLVAACRLRHNLQVSLEFQQGDERLTDHGLILGDHDPHAHLTILTRGASDSVVIAITRAVRSERPHEAGILVARRSRRPARRPGCGPARQARPVLSRPTWAA